MKTVTSNALAELSKVHGTEPMIIVGIEWVAGSVTYYADKTLTGIKAKLLSVGTVDALVLDNHSSSSVDITLDDTDGELKTIIDEHDIHKVKATIYQYYYALNDLADKFVLFSGQIYTPFTWGEKDRSVTFSIISDVISYEVGFSPEEGQLPFVNAEYIGKPWPLSFGSVVYSPAQRVSNTLEGQLQDKICVVDQLLYWKIEWLRLNFYQESFLMGFYHQVADGARALAPAVEDILDQYVEVILEERNSMAIVSQILDDIDQFNRLEKKGVAGIKPFLDNRHQQLDNMSVVTNIVQLKKEYVESLISLAEYKYNVEQDALEKCISSYNNMRQIYQEYVAIQQEVCNETLCVVNQVRVSNGFRFPQNVLTDVYINNVKFRGTFVGDLFTFLDTPTAKLHDVLVDTWRLDDTPCAPTDVTNGVNLFWLKQSPPPNLVGLFLLVKSRTGQRHVVKVDRQIGQKVFFTLVPWNRRVGGHNPSIDEEIGILEDVPFVPTPWGGTLPADVFNTTDWIISEWNQPEPLRLLDIITNIPGGANGHEFELLAKLVFLAPHDKLTGLIIVAPTPRDVYTIIGEDIELVQEASGIPHRSWFDNYRIPFEEVPESLYWSAEPGTAVRTEPDDCVVYIANILPSTVHAVHAFRTLPTGSRVFTAVPSSYYIKNEAKALGTITVTSLTFPVDLKNIEGENWEDDIFVTMTSNVGPNVVDVIKHLIDTYTVGVTANASNFAAIKAQFQSAGQELYPVGFTLFDRPNVLDEITRIAWEARCAIYRVGDEFFLKYLSEEPTEDITFTESDMDNETHLNVVFPQTESLTTRMVALWHPNYKPLNEGQLPYRQIYRHNVKKYQLHSDEIEFHIYNIPELVEKSATFWLIRRSNTWKHVQFQTFLTNIRLDVFDTILFDYVDTFISDEAVKGVIKSIQYVTEDNSLLITVELPIKAGTMEVYPFYWPAALDQDSEFPTEIEIEHGFAGGYGPGDGVTGTFDDC